MLPRGAICSQSFVQEVLAKVAHMTVEAFVLSGSHAVRPMPHNLSWGLASARRRGHSVHEGRAHVLVGEFCQVASEGRIFAFLLPEIVIEVAYMTVEVCLPSGIVSSKYCRERQVVAK